MEPFGKLRVDLSPAEVRETAYEILIGACRSSGPTKRLTYVSNSTKNSRGLSSQKLPSSPSIQRRLTVSSESKVKKALGLNSGGKSGGGTVGDLLRVQMRVSEKTDSRVRRGLLRVAAGQLGRRIESMVLPLELLQHLRASDFTSQQEYEVWLKRNLKVLEAGLLIHPHLPSDNLDTAPKRLQQILNTASEKPFETGKHGELMHVLHDVVTSIAHRSFDGFVSDMCHWADGIPFNLHLYRMLLEACFDVNDEASVIDEVDELLDQIKKTWGVLGIDQVSHNLCFLWVLFHKYITTGETGDDLLVAAGHMMVEVEKDVNSTHDLEYSKILSSTLNIMLDWAEKKLQQYHDIFYRGNINVMQGVLSIGLSAAKILDKSQNYGKNSKDVDVAYDKVDLYIRSSMRIAFSQEREKIISRRKSSTNHQCPLPLLSILAQNITDLAFNEKDIYSPVLKIWHPLATGVAVATLHACFAEELKQFISGVSELNPGAIQVLLAAEKLEKDLVEMAVADSLDSEDGGKTTIQEMSPYETQDVMKDFVKSWIETRIGRLGDWVDRSLQQEDWNPQINKGRFAPSAVEVLRIVDETLEAFILLPIPSHPVLLPELIGGLDRCIKNYVVKAISGCGSRLTFIPALPALTRCAAGLRFGAFKRKDKLLNSSSRKPQVSSRNRDDSVSLPRLCLRINTLHNIRKELDVLEKRTTLSMRKSGYGDVEFADGSFVLSVASCIEGIQQLSEGTAYKLVFHDLRHVLNDYLYIGEISSSRIEPFLQELEKNLEVISVTVNDRVRTRVITDVMKACFEGFVLVLLAGGSSRAFSLLDAPLIEEDFKLLSDLFWSDGDGLPADMINRLSTSVSGTLSLLKTGTDKLIEQLKVTSIDRIGASPESKFLLPPTGQWGPTDPNTILRVLCHRNDKMASRFLKKAYDLPKNT